MSPGDAPGRAVGGHAIETAVHTVNGNGATTPGAIPRLSGYIGSLIPFLCFLEYWFPALSAREFVVLKPV